MTLCLKVERPVGALMVRRGSRVRVPTSALPGAGLPGGLHRGAAPRIPDVSGRASGVSSDAGFCGRSSSLEVTG